MITVAPFANSGQTVLPGIRVWSVARPRIGKPPFVRNLAVLGGDVRYGQPGWETLQSGKCLASLAASSDGAAAWIAIPPVLHSSATNELGRQQDPFITPLVVSTQAASSVFAHTNRMQERALQRPTVDEMPLACSPIVTPFGVIAVFRRRLEVWTFEEDGTARVATYPAQADHTALTHADGEYHQLLVQENAQYPVSPAVVGNNVWVPSDTGVLYCLSIRPSSECT